MPVHFNHFNGVQDFLGPPPCDLRAALCLRDEFITVKAGDDKN
jgi:hypothetical protein